MRGFAQGCQRLYTSDNLEWKLCTVMENRIVGIVDLWRPPLHSSLCECWLERYLAGREKSIFNYRPALLGEMLQTFCCCFSVALRPHKPSGLLGTGSPGWPPRSSHSSWGLLQNMKLREIKSCMKIEVRPLINSRTGLWHPSWPESDARNVAQLWTVRGLHA